LTNYYGFSKYAGELAASSIPSTILRTNFFGRSRCSNRSSLTDWLYRSLTRSDFIEVFDDVMFSPLSMSTVSEMIELSVRYRPVGVFNLGSHNGMSKSDLAFSFADKVGLSTNTMKRTKTNQVSFLKAYRPKDMRMDSDKIERILGIKLPSLIDEIEQAAEDYYEIK
jgi:dTDP-4-dehydrorhamnose reductase